MGISRLYSLDRKTSLKELLQVIPFIALFAILCLSPKLKIDSDGIEHNYYYYFFARLYFLVHFLEASSGASSVTRLEGKR